MSIHNRCARFRRAYVLQSVNGRDGSYGGHSGLDEHTEYVAENIRRHNVSVTQRQYGGMLRQYDGRRTNLAAWAAEQCCGKDYAKLYMPT